MPLNVNGLKHLCKLLPNMGKLSDRKGGMGRIAVVGGSLEYTGAPFYAASAAMRLGCDLVYIFCQPSAAVPIKCYSPELIVHPSIEASKILEKLPRMDAILIGPGLGREPEVEKTFMELINYIASNKSPAVIDADGLWFYSKNCKQLPPLPSVILTPNKIELGRICESMGSFGTLNEIMDIINGETDELTNLLSTTAKKLETNILLKGYVDKLAVTGETVIEVANVCSKRRCGGQGDILSGLLTVCHLWSNRRDGLSDVDKLNLAVQSACELTRNAAALAFVEMGRSMVASDMLPPITKIVKETDELIVREGMSNE